MTHRRYMRRSLALLPLTVLGLLTAVAMVLSLHTSPHVAYFNAPATGNPVVVSRFHDVERTTLNAPSFQARSGADVTNYQAPNRTQGVGGANQDIIIGHTAYLALSADGSNVTQWGEGPRLPLLNKIAGPLSVRYPLTNLLKLTSITQHGNVFTALQLVPAADVQPGLPGQTLLVFSVHTHDGHVTRIRAVFHGFLQTLANLPGGHVKSFTATKVSGGTVNYSEFGRVPPITTPQNNVTHLHPCPDGDILGHVGPHTCGL